MGAPAAASRVSSAAATMLLLVAVVLSLAATAGSYETDPLDPSLSWHQPHDLISFDVAHGDYGDLMWNVHLVLTQHGSRNYVDGSTWVLHRQAYNQKPFRWLMLELTAGDDKIMLAIRQDNLYLAGFTDSKGHWYVFSNKAYLRLIPPATKLRFYDDYRGLIGGNQQLSNIFVSKDTTLRALKEIAGYVFSPTEDTGCVSRAVAIMVLTFCEASRFTPYLLAIRDNWEHGVGIGASYKLAVLWGKMSCAILLSVENGGDWYKSKEAQELPNSEAQVKHFIQLILWPNTCSDPITWLKDN